MTTNGNQCSDTDLRCHQSTSQRSSISLPPPLFQIWLIGEMQELWPQWRTKVHADHAGHSLLLEPWKVSPRSALVNWSPFQNNSWLTAQPIWAMLVAMEDGCSVHSISPLTLLWSLKLTMPTPVRMVSASKPNMKDKSNSLMTELLSQTPQTNSWLLLPDNPFQLPSKPTNQSSNPTPVESLPVTNAEPTLTTESSWSDMDMMLPSALTTGSSRTPGVLPGVRKDSSES